MISRTIELKSGVNNSSATANLLLCNKCGNEEFVAFVITSIESVDSVDEIGHLHLQCTECHMSFCKGKYDSL